MQIIHSESTYLFAVQRIKIIPNYILNDLTNQWPNLKNLSGGLNLSRGQIVSNVSRFKPALNLNRVLADLNRGSNSKIPSQKH